MSEGQEPRQLGRYRILRRLGAGGMAEVFLARSTGAEGIEKVLVVKRVLPTFARSEKFISMFLEEAKIATRLNHPNIVQVYAFEQVGEEFLLAMEYVDGPDLGRLASTLRRTKVKMPPPLAAYILMEIAKGLDYAHKRKDESGEAMEIVHRDVSPQNVLVSYDGIVKIADFGIAKARMVSEETGVIKGKFSYMSPEQARGDVVDRRSDVYSLGVLLAELLMNRAMYPAQHGLDVLDRVRRGDITPPIEVDPTVPTTLDAIVVKATAMDPEARFLSARVLAAALGRYLHAQEQVVDGETLEAFVRRCVPREDTQPSNRIRADSGSFEAPSASGPEQTRERRHVVVVAARFHGSLSEVPPPVKRVLSDVAYKADGVLRWHEAGESPRMQIILGLRRASVHDPLSAMLVALDVVEALGGLSADLSTPLEVSLGVSRGVLNTTRDRSGRLLSSEPVGAVLEVAHRLAEEGDIDEILVAGEVYRLVRRTFAFHQERSREVQLSERVRLRVNALRGARTREERAADALGDEARLGWVGRADELRAVTEAYHRALKKGGSSAVAIVGELGVGKTALVAKALSGLDPEARLIHAECPFGTYDVPYGALAELVEHGLAVEEGAPRASIEGRIREVAEELGADPESLLVGLGALLSPGSEQGVEGKAERIRRASLSLFRAFAEQGPVVLWVDAVQWADDSSLELFLRATRELQDLPLFFVVTTRPDPRVERLLAAIPRVSLGELGPKERRELVVSRFEGASVPGDIADAVVERAGGNPFFIIELVEALLERGVVQMVEDEQGARVERDASVAIALPTTLEGVVAARLEELPEAERRAVRWLAVAGPGHSTLALKELTREDLAASLAAAAERGLLVRQGEGYGFVSAVVRHVAYETTDGEDRLAMHKRVASWLLSSGSASPARIARHLEHAGQRAEAARAFLEAAEAAAESYANRNALRFYGRVLTLVAPDSSEAFVAHEKRERIFGALGRREEQVLELAALRSLADRTQRPDFVAVAYVRFARHELEGERLETIAAHLQRAMEAASQAERPELEGEAWLIHSDLAMSRGDEEAALAASDHALAIAERADLQADRARALRQRARMLGRMGRTDEALELNAQATVIFSRLGLLRDEAGSLCTMAIAMRQAGHLEDAVALLRASLGLDRRTGDRRDIGRKLGLVGQLAAEIGDREQAVSFLVRACLFFMRVPDDGSLTDALLALADVRLEEEALDRAEEHLAEVRDVAGRSRSAGRLAPALAREELIRSRLRFLQGNLDEAADAAKAALQRSEELGDLPAEIRARACLAHALARGGHPTEARLHLTKLETQVRDASTRAEVFLAMARAYAHLGDHVARDSAFARADETVSRRLERLRSPETRSRYFATSTVSSIRQRRV